MIRRGDTFPISQRIYVVSVWPSRCANFSSEYSAGSRLHKKWWCDNTISRVRPRQNSQGSIRRTRLASHCERTRTFAAFRCPCRQSRSWSSARLMPPRLSRHPMGIAYPVNGHVLLARLLVPRHNSPMRACPIPTTNVCN